MDNYLKILSQDDETAVAGGYGVLFGGRDLDEDQFQKSTDYDLDLVPRKFVYVDHTLDDVIVDGEDVYVLKGIDDPVGEVIEVTPDDVGLYMKLVFSKADRYWEIVEKMLASKRVGLSTGSIPHLMRRDPDGVIKRWPIVETSLTMTPAEPRTVSSVSRIKRILDANPNLSPDQFRDPKATRKIAATDTGDGANLINLKSKNGESKMEPKDIEALREVIRDEVEALYDRETKSREDAAKREEEIAAEVDRRVKAEIAQLTPDNDVPSAKNVNFNSKTKLGDDETKAYAHFLRTGDASGIKASNDTDMNIGTAADGGNAVPTGHYQGIIARRDESMLSSKLGVRNIPGKGTTVNVPFDNEDDGEFVSTGEAVAYDRDAPAIGQKALTLVKYTKKVEMSVELLEDEDSRILAFLNDFVGRGMAKTHNNLLLTEVGSNGTSLKTFASATAIAGDELEPIVYDDALDPYLDDTGSVSWVMKRSVHGEIILLDDANIRRYSPNALGQAGPSLLGFPVAYSAKSGATAASAKSVYFGNWNFVGYREAPGFTVLRDPYSKASTGQIVFHYMFRAVYGVLIAEAIGYGEHPSA